MSRRFTESIFRQYELVIAQAVNQYPEVVIVNPVDKGIQSDTMATRIRDSITGFLGKNWYSSHIDEAKLLSLSSSLVVADLQTHVAIGGKEQIRTLRSKPAIEPVKVDDCMMTIDGSDEELVRAVACLMSHKIIPGPVVVRNCNIPIEQLEIYKDVAVIRNGSDLTLI